MGCTKAFDVPDPNIIEVLLQKHGWPDKSGSLLPLGPKMRYVSWGHHTHVIRSTSRAKRPQKQQAIPTPCRQSKQKFRTTQKRGIGPSSDSSSLACSMLIVAQFFAFWRAAAIAPYRQSPLPPGSTSFRPCQMASSGSMGRLLVWWLVLPRADCGSEMLLRHCCFVLSHDLLHVFASKIIGPRMCWKL